MISMFIGEKNTETGAIIDYEFHEGTGDPIRDVLLRHAYELRILNDALLVRVKELQNAYGCENCRGNPLTMPISKEASKAAFRAVFRDFPEWAGKKSFPESIINTDLNSK